MKKRKITRQLFLSYQFIILFFLIAVIIYTSYFIRDFFYTHVEADLRENAYLLKNQIESYLIADKSGELDPICKQIGKSVSTRITVMFPNGKVICDTEEAPEKMDNHAFRPEVRQVLVDKTDGTAIRYSKTLQKDIMYVAIPLRYNGNIIGVLRTSVNVRSLKSELRLIQNGVMIMGVVIALIVTGISLLMSRKITRPIVEMKKGAERFSRGELGHRLYVSESEELGGLADAMNEMAAQLDDRIRTVIRQRNELEAVLSSMREGVMAINPDEKVISINQAAARMFNHAPPKVTGRTIQEVVRNHELHKFIKKSLSCQTPADEDIEFYHDGDRILNIHSTPLCEATGEYIGTLLVLNDVTRLRQLENMRRDFAANVSHELKTPLTAIQGFVETLQHGAINDPEKAVRFLGIIEKHVERLGTIIEDLMYLSKIEEQRKSKEIRLEPGNISDVIQTAIQMCQPKADEKNISIELAGEENITANINHPLLEQAAMNLLDNAIKYSEDNSVINISIQKIEGEIIIKFQDHGIGIANVHLPRLFERFYRVDKARSRKQGGTGLGLAIVKHIVQSHEGHVTVESTMGQGSLFVIHLPMGGEMEI